MPTVAVRGRFLPAPHRKGSDATLSLWSLLALVRRCGLVALASDRRKSSLTEGINLAMQEMNKAKNLRKALLVIAAGNARIEKPARHADSRCMSSTAVRSISHGCCEDRHRDAEPIRARLQSKRRAARRNISHSANKLDASPRVAASARAHELRIRWSGVTTKPGIDQLLIQSALDEDLLRRLHESPDEVFRDFELSAEEQDILRHPDHRLLPLLGAALARQTPSSSASPDVPAPQPQVALQAHCLPESRSPSPWCHARSTKTGN